MSLGSSRGVLFARLIARPLLREPLRTALTVFAVALGVGVVIAIDLAGDAAAGSFHSSVESLTGKNDLLITGTAGIDEELLGKLVRLPYAFRFHPRIEDFASVNGQGEAIPFIGFDLIASAQELTPSGDDSTFAKVLASDRPVWISSALGFQPGSRIRLLINDRMTDFTVAGVLDKKNNAAGQNVIVADIGLAQWAAGKLGRLDSIDVEVPHEGSLSYWRALLQKQLPESVRVEPQGSRTDENRKMLAAFRWNLHVLSYIALIVGAFLIYNTISISVVRRRSEIGVARALGATRGAVMSAFLLEAGLFAVVGSLLGIVLGRLMAIAAVALIGNTVQALYVSSQPASISLKAVSVVSAVLLGTAVSLAAALAPVFEAAHVPPVEAMARGREQYVAATQSRPRFIAAVLMFAAAAVLSFLPPIGRQPIFAYAAALLLIAGTAAAVPGIIEFTAGALQSVLRRSFGIEAVLAMRALRASIGRTSILITALSTAVAMTASVGIMVGSFRETVSLWMLNQLKADLYMRPAGAAAADQHPTMSPDVADKIEQLPEVAAVDRFRSYPIFYRGLPATLAGGESSANINSASPTFLPGQNRAAILAQLPQGNNAIVSEPFASKHGVGAGSTLTLPLAGAVRHFRVLGIYYDYSTERGFIVLDRKVLLKYLPDPAVSSVSVYLKPGAQLESVRRKVDGIIAGRRIVVFSNASLRKAAIATFDRTFRITYALEAVAVTVAVMGIAGSLLAMVIDRRREFALLRFLGAYRPQIRRLILCEAGLIGLLAVVVGSVVGTLLSLILVFVINKQSFGWTLQFHWPIAALSGALMVVYVATVLAGFYPAAIALRMNPIEVIHEE
jgi:putative ABC transport system permease protein